MIVEVTFRPMRSQESLQKIYAGCLGREDVHTELFQEKMDMLEWVEYWIVHGVLSATS